MSTCNSRPEGRTAWFGIGGLTGGILALAVIGAVVATTPNAYAQMPGAANPGGATAIIMG